MSGISHQLTIHPLKKQLPRSCTKDMSLPRSERVIRASFNVRKILREDEVEHPTVGFGDNPACKLVIHKRGAVVQLARHEYNERVLAKDECNVVVVQTIHCWFVKVTFLGPIQHHVDFRALVKKLTLTGSIHKDLSRAKVHAFATLDEGEIGRKDEIVLPNSTLPCDDSPSLLVEVELGARVALTMANNHK